MDSPDRSYYRIMLGPKSMYADQCHEGGFIGVYFGADFGRDVDLSNELVDDWRQFNAKFRPIFLERYPEKSKVVAGLACGSVHTICKGIKKRDIVLCPNGQGEYLVGELAGDYYFVPDTFFPHRRKVSWYPQTIDRSDMSEALKNSAGSIGTVSNVTKHFREIESLMQGNNLVQVIVTDSEVEDPSVFALEKHLEDFLVKNWNQTELGKEYDIYQEEGEIVGQQYPSDTGPIDILAISKDRKTLLVVELKKGRVSDAVVGQVQRYMGFVQAELAEEGQTVKGCIIGLEDDQRIKRALIVAPNIEFYRYRINFSLYKE